LWSDPSQQQPTSRLRSLAVPKDEPTVPPQTRAKPDACYLRVRRATDGVQALFTTDEGGPITHWGGQSIFRRLIWQIILILMT